MPSTSYPGRKRRPWLTWGVPIAILVLLAASAAGVASREIYAGSEPTRSGQLLTLPVSPEGGSRVVAMSEGVLEHPNYNAVRSVLQNHFDSINDGNYARWQTTVVEQREQELPQDEWMASYASTRDRDIRVLRLEPGPDDSLRVLISFISLQDPDEAPDGISDCLRWRVVYPLVLESGQLLLDVSEYAGSSLYESC